MESLLVSYCDVDDFSQVILPICERSEARDVPRNDRRL